MHELPQRGDTRGHIYGVLQADIRADHNISVADLLKRDPPAELLREGAGNQPAGPGLRMPAGEPPTDLHMIGTNRLVSPVAFTQLTHPPAEPLVADPGLAHHRC
ncbi:MAG: hypothetical protein ACRDRP_19780 [Pseudonocardiaceae bacterium]